MNIGKTQSPKRSIITGTPGAGKTSLLRALECRGYPVVEEAATDLIALEQAQGNNEPWTHPSFIDHIITLQKQRQVNAAYIPSAVQFFDRSPVCTYALSVYLRFPPSPLLLEELQRIKDETIYQKQVFFIANLGYVEPTAARRISYEESLAFEKIHKEAYRSHGYECITIPAKPLKERVEEVLKRIKE